MLRAWNVGLCNHNCSLHCRNFSSQSSKIHVQTSSTFLDKNSSHSQRYKQKHFSPTFTAEQTYMSLHIEHFTKLADENLSRRGDIRMECAIEHCKCGSE